MNKDSGKISLMLDFLSKHSRDERVQLLLGRGKYVFYLIPCEEFGEKEGKSLLEYIVAQGSRMMRQKEELIDLAIKMAKIKIEAEYIKQFKADVENSNKMNSKLKNELRSQPVQDIIKKYVEGLLNGDEFQDQLKSATEIDLEVQPYSGYLSQLQAGLVAAADQASVLYSMSRIVPRRCCASSLMP